LSWLEIKSELVLNIVQSCLDFSLNILLTFIIKLNASAQNRSSPLLKSRCQIYVSRNYAFIEEVNHSFIDVVLSNGRGIVASLKHGSGCLGILVNHPPLLVFVEIAKRSFGSVACPDSPLLEDASATAGVFANVDIGHGIIGASLRCRGVNVGELEIRQLLLCAAKVLHHRSHEQLILFLKAIVDAFQLRLELVKVRGDLA
jgi:hypothetical protein